MPCFSWNSIISTIISLQWGSDTIASRLVCNVASLNFDILLITYNYTYVYTYMYIYLMCISMYIFVIAYFKLNKHEACLGQGGPSDLDVFFGRRMSWSKPRCSSCRPWCYSPSSRSFLGSVWDMIYRRLSTFSDRVWICRDWILLNTIEYYWYVSMNSDWMEI